MLIKEYRVLMPLSVDEYRIAQLYMIAKKSRVDSSGKEHGVEIIKNEPYENGPGGSGQYTNKVYHIGSKIPAWIRSILPTSALEAHEEAWNAYPFTKTRYTSPMLGDRFNIEVETHYLDDAGTTENKFNLSPEEYKSCTIDVLDFVKDPISHHEYCPEEDPKIYKSAKTQRGPLTENWVEEHIKQGKPVMCAYKLCRVEFRYWGLQTRAERWIHELALRGTMLRAHRQAWSWQDEWVGLDIAEIRRYEEETARYLSSVMASCSSGISSPHLPNNKRSHRVRNSVDSEESFMCGSENASRKNSRREPHRLSVKDRDKMRAASIDEERASLMSSDVYFDCCDEFPVEAHEQMSFGAGALKRGKQPLVRWNSELLSSEPMDHHNSNLPLSPKFPGKSSLLILVFHADFFPNTSADTKITDINTLRTTIDHLITSHYPLLRGRVHLHRVTCGSELGPMVSTLNGIFPSTNGEFHPSMALLLSANSQLFVESVQSTIKNANRVVNSFLASEEGSGFSGEIFAIGDCIGGILLYEALAKSVHEIVNSAPCPIERHSSSVSAQSSPFPSGQDISQRRSSRSLNNCYAHLQNFTSDSRDSEDLHHFSPTGGQNHVNGGGTQCRSASKLSTSSNLGRNMSAPPVSTGQQNFSDQILAFRPNATFLLGCPLAQLIMHRKLALGDELNLRIDCDQLFNIYYSLDICGMRLEPVLNSQLSLLPPLQVPRYQRYPLGDGQSIHFDHSTNALMVWGDRRVDHQLFCPQEMNSLPPLALPNVLHASYWESKDVGSFILRQFASSEDSAFFSGGLLMSSATDTPLEFQIPLATWNRRRTRFKIANLSANHRANDVIVVEGLEQVINSRFCYGPMDLVALSLETVLIYVCPNGGEWFHHSSENTDKNGRLTINLGTLLPVGVHSVRLIVRGDRSFVSMFVAVVPPKTPVVVFSIDGSLTCSVSVTGRDPRLRPGAVDLVRFWQQQGYIIIYLTARPDFSQRLVSAWLNQHNFPHGLLFFTPSISTDPLRQKAQYMRHLVDIGVKIQAAYGSGKDVQVYSMAGLGQEQIFTVGSAKRRGCCTYLEEGYSQHIQELQGGKFAAIAHPICPSPGSTALKQLFFPSIISNDLQHSSSATGQHAFVNRTTSFTPRSGKYRSDKVESSSTSPLEKENPGGITKKQSQISPFHLQH